MRPIHDDKTSSPSSSIGNSVLPADEKASLFQIDPALVSRVTKVTVILAGGIALYKCRHIVASVAAVGAAYWLSGSSLLQKVHSFVRNAQTLGGLGLSAGGFTDQIKKLLTNNDEKLSSLQEQKKDSSISKVDSPPSSIVNAIENVESDDDSDSPNPGQVIAEVSRGQQPDPRPDEVDYDMYYNPQPENSSPSPQPESAQPPLIQQPKNEPYVALVEARSLLSQDNPQPENSSPSPQPESAHPPLIQQPNNEPYAALVEAHSPQSQVILPLNSQLSLAELDKHFEIQTGMQPRPFLLNPHHLVPVPLSFPPIQGLVGFPQPVIPVQNGLNVQLEPLAPVKNPALSEQQKPSNQENSADVHKMVEMYLESNKPLQEQSPTQPEEEEDMYGIPSPDLTEVRNAFESVYPQGNPFLRALKSPDDPGSLVLNDVGSHLPQLRSML